jgi:hypothetical protein
MPTASHFIALFSLLLLSPLTLIHAAPSSPSNSTEQITCFPHTPHPGQPLLTTAQANALVNEFNRIACQSNPNAPFSLAPLEGVEITLPGGFILFKNELDKEATPPNCGEVVGDFVDLVEECFKGRPVPGGVLIETAGGGRTSYVISGR